MAATLLQTCAHDVPPPGGWANRLWDGEDGGGCRCCIGADGGGDGAEGEASVIVGISSPPASAPIPADRSASGSAAAVAD